MTNIRKIAILLITAIGILAVLFLYILNILLTEEKVTAPFYYSLVIFIFIVAWLFWGIRYYGDIISHVHTQMEANGLAIDTIRQRLLLLTQTCLMPAALVDAAPFPPEASGVTTGTPATTSEPSEDTAEPSVALSEASEGMAETSATVSEASEQSAETSPIVSEASAGISPSSVSNSQV